jgi:hypothetical protein
MYTLVPAACVKTVASQIAMGSTSEAMNQMARPGKKNHAVVFLGLHYL